MLSRASAMELQAAGITGRLQPAVHAARLVTRPCRTRVARWLRRAVRNRPVHKLEIVLATSPRGEKVTKTWSPSTAAVQREPP